MGILVFIKYMTMKESRSAISVSVPYGVCNLYKKNEKLQRLSKIQHVSVPYGDSSLYKLNSRVGLKGGLKKFPSPMGIVVFIKQKG